jgi:hypothetical protein
MMKDCAIVVTVNTVMPRTAQIMTMRLMSMIAPDVMVLDALNVRSNMPDLCIECGCPLPPLNGCEENDFRYICEDCEQSEEGD